jgi:hypothetical protein
VHYEENERYRLNRLCCYISDFLKSVLDANTMQDIICVLWISVTFTEDITKSVKYVGSFVPFNKVALKMNKLLKIIGLHDNTHMK